MTSSAAPARALVIGGSLTGLFVANLLTRSGWTVDVFERSPSELSARGGGIVLQPEVIEILARIGAGVDALRLGVPSQHRIVLAPDGSIVSKQRIPQIQTSWSLLYSALRSAFPGARYHQGMALTGITQDRVASTVTARFAGGAECTADLLVGADGGDSLVRSLLFPEAAPRYAGYVAWRGLLPEREMPASAGEVLLGEFGFSHNIGSHNLGYLVPGPGNDLRPGHRLYNWVWYRLADSNELRSILTDRDGNHRKSAVAEGQLSDHWVDHLSREAPILLPPAFADVVRATRHPFVQAVRDLAAPGLVAGRAILAGDAAAIPRPHTAASTSKAAVNALTLAHALDVHQDIDSALAQWQPAQVRLGRALMDQGMEMGDRLLFGRTPSPAARSA